MKLSIEEVKKELAALSYRTGTYFKEEFALEVKPVFDAILSDGKSRQFSAASFGKYKASSVKTRLQQSIKYLIEYMDTPNKDYANIKSRLLVKVREDKVIFHITETRIKTGGSSPERLVFGEGEIIEQEPNDKELKEEARQAKKEQDIKNRKERSIESLRTVVAEFLCNAAPGETFEKINLKLGNDAIEILQSLIDSMGDEVLGIVEANKIKIHKRKPTIT